MGQGCDVPSGPGRGSAGEQRLTGNASRTCFATGCLGSPRERPGAGAEPGVIDNFLVTAWILLPFQLQILSPSWSAA